MTDILVGRFVKGFFMECSIVTNKFKSVSIVSFSNLPEDCRVKNNKAREVMNSNEKHASRVVTSRSK